METRTNGTVATKSTATLQLEELYRAVKIELSPEPYKVYKAKDGRGMAMKLDLRVAPVWGISPSGTHYLKGANGGMWLELAPEDGKNAKGDPKFAWANPREEKTTDMVAKIGMPDIQSFLVGIQHRPWLIYAKKPLPKSGSLKNGDTISCFHKFGEGENNTTIIEYKFLEDGAFLNMSKSKTLKRAIKLSVQDEVGVHHYMDYAHRLFLKYGM